MQSLLLSSLIGGDALPCRCFGQFGHSIDSTCGSTQHGHDCRDFKMKKKKKEQAQATNY
jgi:hypothetical protein